MGRMRGPQGEKRQGGIDPSNPQIIPMGWSLPQLLLFFTNPQLGEIRHLGEEPGDLSQQGQAVGPYPFVLVHDHAMVEEGIDWRAQLGQLPEGSLVVPCLDRR